MSVPSSEAESHRRAPVQLSVCVNRFTCAQSRTIARANVEARHAEPQAADGGAADGAGAESRLRFYVNGNGSSSGRRRDDVARAEVYREDDVREVRGLAELILPSQRDAEEGTGGFVLAGSALLGLEPPRWWGSISLRSAGS